MHKRARQSAEPDILIFKLGHSANRVVRFWSFIRATAALSDHQPASFITTFSKLQRAVRPLTHCNMQRIPGAIAPSRPLLETLFNLPARECRRFVSSHTSLVRRPVAASAAQCRGPAQQYQPLVQKRFKFKTVEEAKSRYRSGVRFSPSAPYPSGVTSQLTSGNHSPSPGKPASSSSPRAPDSSTTSSTRRSA